MKATKFVEAVYKALDGFEGDEDISFYLFDDLRDLADVVIDDDGFGNDPMSFYNAGRKGLPIIEIASGSCYFFFKDKKVLEAEVTEILKKEIKDPSALLIHPNVGIRAIGKQLTR